MRIPAHWAEARLVGKVRGRQRVVRRFGWSDDGQAAAAQHANDRAAAAMAELQAGQKVWWRERKAPYGTPDGLPIREEIVAKNGDLVITRNAYGARCLNVADVLFADLDLDFGLHWVQRVLVLTSAATIVAAGFSLGPRGCWVPVIGLLLPLLVISHRTSWFLRFNATYLRSRFARRLMDRVHGLAAREPKVRLAVYETPAGLRVLALHRRFDPRSADADAVFEALGTDTAYRQLCKVQACFRARVSAKPWRIGMGDGIKPRRVWPIPEELRARREQWIGRYEREAARFAACRFLFEVGEGPTDPRAAAVQAIHDELCRARTELPIA
jgi:hypothetical protein